MKLVANVPEEELKIVDEAREIEKRTRASFVRFSCLERAKKILEDNKNGE